MGARINDLQRKSFICKESENDTYRFPQINIGSQKAAIKLFATLSEPNALVTRTSLKEDDSQKVINAPRRGGAQINDR